jgi:hypothetical protein
LAVLGIFTVLGTEALSSEWMGGSRLLVRSCPSSFDGAPATPLFLKHAFFHPEGAFLSLPPPLPLAV